LGQWTATAEAWLPYGAWAACESPRPVELGETVFLGFDGSWSGDSTALVGVTADCHVFVEACWENPGQPDWRVPRDEVQDAIEMAFEKYEVAQLVCDPPYWRREITEWDQRWPDRVVEFPTFSRARMAPACTTFYAAVMDRMLTHDGDARLARHLGNAVVKPSPQGDYITKVDKDSPAKIDLAVAAVLAFDAVSRAHRPSELQAFFG
jgi:phage terminase large subunit-like protein